MLTELDIEGNKVCKRGVFAFISSLRYISLLKILKMTPLDEESFILLAHGFRQVPKLQRLILRQGMMKALALFHEVPIITMRVTTAETIFRNLLYLRELQELYIPEISSEGNQDSGIVQAYRREIIERQSLYFGVELHYDDINAIKSIVRRFEVRK